MTRAFDLVGQAAEVIEPVLRDPRLRPHLGEQLAVLLGLDRRDAIGVLGDHLAPLHQQASAAGRRQRAHGPSRNAADAACTGLIHFGRPRRARRSPIDAAGRRIEAR